MQLNIFGYCSGARRNPGVYAEVTSVLPWVLYNIDDSNPLKVPENCRQTKWWKDFFCDDENNNADCNWDGGDCCPSTNPSPNLKRFCQACECLDPNAQ